MIIIKMEGVAQYGVLYGCGISNSYGKNQLQVVYPITTQRREVSNFGVMMNPRSKRKKKKMSLSKTKQNKTKRNENKNTSVYTWSHYHPPVT
jgi:hypothetical protein